MNFQTRCIKCDNKNEGYVVASIEARCAVEYFDPSENVQKKKFAFKCHRSKNSEGISVLYPVNTISFHPKCNIFATGGCDGYVDFWNPITKKRILHSHQYPTSISSICFNCNGNIMAISSSYTFEMGDITHPMDEIYIKKLNDSDYII